MRRSEEEGRGRGRGGGGGGEECTHKRETT